MPPKCSAPSKKTEEKKKAKVIEDKTFGLKNKKGAKQQKFIQMVQHQVKNPNQSLAKLEAQKHDAKKKIEDDLADLNKLLKPVTAMPKIDKDVDPKSILCVFFKQGMCTKGDKCKWSHDMEIERKSEKRNIYVDKREDDEDNVDNWDDAKLHEVVDKKHAEKDANKPKTAIICKHFLQALEESKYGWFWECPNGDKCIYRHALPSDYVLKKDRVKLDALKKEDEITLEDLIEKERAALGSNLPKVTFESFCLWKHRKRKERERKRVDEEKRKRTELKAGKESGLSGRELFTFNPDLVTQDDEEADDTRYSVHSDEEEGDKVEAREIDEAMFANGYACASASAGEFDPMAIDEELFDENDVPDDDEEDEEENEESNDDVEEDVETLKENVQRLDLSS